MILIVPNELRNAINRALDDAMAECPEAECERNVLYKQLLAHFDEHGVIPQFTITKKGTVD